MSDVLTIHGLTVSAPSGAGVIRIVDNVSLSLRAGEIVGLIGESGAGKSTIGLAALAYTKPGCKIESGTIRFMGRGAGEAVAPASRGNRIAYVAQSAAAAFNPAKRLLQQIIEVPVHHGILTADAAREQIIDLFRQLDLPDPENFGTRYPHQVSGGQLQRAMLAMAMSCRPDVIVFDEPTTALDVTTQVEALAAIRRLVRDHHTAGLYISHDLAVVAQIADRVMVLKNGMTVEIGTTDAILRFPTQQYTRQLVTVRSTTTSLAPAVAAGQPVLLDVQRVSARYGAVTALDDVSLNVRVGETVAVVGESGSGKSTLGNVICGLRPADQGRIHFREDLLAAAMRKRNPEQLRRIQMIYQSPDLALNPRQKIRDILGRPLRFYFGLTAAAARQRVAELLAMVDLPTHYADRYPASLSGGQKQRICIARALSAKPDLIVCDEVTGSLDSLVAEEMLKLLSRIQRETQTSYLFITHDMNLVRRIAHRVVVMRKGKIVDTGALSDIFSPPMNPYVDLLLASVPEMRRDWLDEAIGRKLLIPDPSDQGYSQA